MDCFALSEKWADETFFHEHCRFVYPETNKVVSFTEVERMYGENEIRPLLKKAGFIDVNTALTLKGDEPAQEGRHFAFWCIKTNMTEEE